MQCQDLIKIKTYFAFYSNSKNDLQNFYNKQADHMIPVYVMWPGFDLAALLHKPHVFNEATVQ
jgi:hypothetical protein